MGEALTKKGIGGAMPLTGHLKELRNRLLLVAGVFLAVTAVTLSYAGTFVTALMDMAIRVNDLYQFIAISPQEKLLQYFRVSLVAGGIVAVPLALYQIWAFAKPGLKKSESRFFGLALLGGLGLFCVGVFFAYRISLPFMLNFLVTVGEGDVAIVTSISIEKYVSFVLTIFLIFGAVFEMPLLSVVLAKLGIANPTVMRKGRGVAIVLCFIVAAIITPPDIVSQVMVALPMLALYELSIGLCILSYHPHADEGEDAEESDEPAQAAV